MIILLAAVFVCVCIAYCAAAVEFAWTGARNDLLLNLHRQYLLYSLGMNYVRFSSWSCGLSVGKVGSKSYS
ncbi:unnamed protein product [Lathyrus sativus]|nr:unnamed protein product [Lathyrus sativus]